MIGLVQNMLVKLDDDKFSYGHFRRATLWRKVFRRNLVEICYWLFFVGLLGLVYKFFSDKTFSGILTGSALFQCFGLILLVVKVVRQSSAAGLSARSLQLFLIATCFRLFCNVKYSAYLPVDRSGDWVYQVADMFTVVLLVALCGMVYIRYSDTYPAHLDTFSAERPVLTTVIPITISLFLAIFVRPRLAEHPFGDFAWVFSLYLDSLAMLPQLVLMSRVGGEVEALTSHYVACIALSKVLSFTFWLFSYRELAPRLGFNVAGWAVIGAHLFQLLLFADFVYHYIRSIRNGRRLILSM